MERFSEISHEKVLIYLFLEWNNEKWKRMLVVMEARPSSKMKQHHDNLDYLVNH